MSFISHKIFDGGYDSAIFNCEQINICSQEPATHAEPTGTLGQKAATAAGQLTSRQAGGRQPSAPLLAVSPQQPEPRGNRL